MIHLEKYSDKYEEQLKSIDMIAFNTVNYHADVLAASVRVAVDGERLIGVGYLKAGATFLKADESDLPYYFIHAEYITDDESDPEEQIEASELLLEELKRQFDELCDKYADKRLILRLWCNSTRTAYQEFLMAHGFRVMRVMPILVRELVPEDEDADEKIILSDGEALDIREMDPYDDAFMHAYMVTNREAFEVEDSANELRFVMGGEDSHVFAVMKGERVIASVTLWHITDERAATENIFCAEDYRKKGVTSALLQYVFGFLRKKGYEFASLTVFGDNLPAIGLYFKLGYELEGNMLELHYEKNYKNIGF